jgi:hypothetical protein
MIAFASSLEQSYSRAFVTLTERRFETPHVRVSGDLLLYVSSPEPRCLEILRTSGNNFGLAAVLRFTERDREGRRERHDSALLTEAAQRAREVAHLSSLSIFDYDEWMGVLTNLLVDARHKIGHPLDVVLDGSCLPKHYLLFIMGLGFRAGLIRRLRIFYAEANYQAARASSAAQSAKGSATYQFSTGAWKAFSVPYFEGDVGVERPTRAIVSLGHETFRARTFVKSYEADRHVVVLASPGFSPDVEMAGDAEADAFLNYLEVPSDAVFRCPAGSARSVATLLDSVAEGSTRRYHDIGICIGTKPHTVGMGVAGLLYEDMTLICRIPEGYPTSATGATGISWVYQVEDRSSPPFPGQRA